MHCWQISIRNKSCQYSFHSNEMISNDSNEAFPMAQLVKNPPAVRETWVRFLGWEDPLKQGKATHSSILAYRFPQTV